MIQAQALETMLKGENVFLTGAAGSGKTYVLNEFIKLSRELGKEVAVTASTGIAATHIGGVTIHSWAGIGIKNELHEKDLARIRKNSILVDKISDTDILIIDEISMLDDKRFDLVNIVSKMVRGNERPFGGIQIIVCGDFFQLPPISRDGEKHFVFKSPSWQEAQFEICYLKDQYRQEDEELLEILGAIRGNTVNDNHIERLQSQIIVDPEDTLNATQLFTHNLDVDRINSQRLSHIDEAEHLFHMRTTGDKYAIDSMIRGCLAPQVLVLKKGAEVMFVANNFSGRFVNGTRGRVVDFDGDAPIVRVGRRTITVEPHTWKLEDTNETRAEITQIPLRLAWAITVHKSQGMSLDSATIDLSKAFEPGMGYVALSRVRTLSGIKLTGINNVALRIDPEVFEFDKTLRSLSRQN